MPEINVNVLTYLYHVSQALEYGVISSISFYV